MVLAVHGPRARARPAAVRGSGSPGARRSSACSPASTPTRPSPAPRGRSATARQVILSDQGQAAADFHLFTSTPVAGQFQGLTTDDIAIETNPASPSFGDKWGPAFLPISMRDFKGQEIYRGYSDAFGRYNGVLPSTFTANIPVPSGYSPAMHLRLPERPGADPGTRRGVDSRPPAQPELRHLLLHVAVHAGDHDVPRHAAPPEGGVRGRIQLRGLRVPRRDAGRLVRSTTAPDPGPLVSSRGHRSLTSLPGRDHEVPNPAYEGPLAPAPYNQPTITRDFGFGATPGTVTLGGVPRSRSSPGPTPGSQSGPIPAVAHDGRTRGHPRGQRQELDQHGHRDRRHRNCRSPSRPAARSRPRSTRRPRAP